MSIGFFFFFQELIYKVHPRLGTCSIAPINQNITWGDVVVSEDGSIQMMNPWNWEDLAEPMQYNGLVGGGGGCAFSLSLSAFLAFTFVSNVNKIKTASNPYRKPVLFGIKVILSAHSSISSLLMLHLLKGERSVMHYFKVILSCVLRPDSPLACSTGRGG